MFTLQILLILITNYVDAERLPAGYDELGKWKMNQVELTPDELLAGAAIAFDVVIPPHILHPGEQKQSSSEGASRELIVQLRPLTIGTFQLIMKASRNDPALIPLLMIKESLVQPQLSLEQVRGMHLGLVNFLIAQIRQISGLVEKKT